MSNIRVLFLLLVSISTVASAQTWTPELQAKLKAVGSPNVSPDGKRVMYARLNPTADVWILEGIGGRNH